jgi:FkbM family methyltransferase
MKTKLKKLAQAVISVDPEIKFTILEIGALPLGDKSEQFHQLVDLFPGSRIIAFELEKDLCDELNAKAPSGISYYPVALGYTEESRLLFQTNHQMCCSLYKPREDLLRQYNGLEVAMLRRVSTVDTVSLDYFLQQHDIIDVDFLKIDIQGAELDVFRGGLSALKDIVAIVTEVEFIPLYYKQPLFGDVSAFLTGNGFMFHKFTGMAGRTLKPVTIGNDLSHATQHMWADAVFIKDILTLEELPVRKLLKLGILSYLYGSPDVAFRCFEVCDIKKLSNLCQLLLDL